MNERMFTTLSGHIGIDDIRAFVSLLEGRENDGRKSDTFDIMLHDEGRAGQNAAWILTHLDDTDNRWLFGKHDILIDEAMRTASVSKRRLILTMLNKQPFPPEEFRTEFLNFCLDHLERADEPPGVRALCMKLAFKQCRHIPELVSELKQLLEYMDDSPVSPGIRTTKKNIIKEMSRRH